MAKNILYIEDNPDNMLLVKRVLVAGGYNVLEAENGEQGTFRCRKPGGGSHSVGYQSA